ncbi:hypothetical protein THIOM_002180 [Candidatus Thiomargarita nelsonii]|uniref:N-acetyltransferase domain-containing protein n=1 Tax=Candidatus Thiomargarita nelsonii TaxID=1003181 RepID=A0A0A6RL85_9GAMM|nr:hypothetical protein THIOM_002180 [Candidatus Thiomargarita nelsonii]
MNNRYTQWLINVGGKLYKAGGIYWRKYNGALVPAKATQCYVELDDSDIKLLLKESKAWFIRYSSNPQHEVSSWWYIVCQQYDKARLSGNTRSKVNRGRKRCEVRLLDAVWMEEHGYECYRAAYRRYINATPVDEKTFKRSIAQKRNGPFEWWGVFFGDTLAGYCECLVEENEVATNIIKLHPDYLKQYSSYALFDVLLTHYQEKGMVISNGNRSIAHDTNMQDFLIKFGFEKQYCILNVHYSMLLNMVIALLYPMRFLINKLPDKFYVYHIKSILFQHNIVRDCNNG